MTNIASLYARATTTPFTALACLYCVVVFAAFNLSGEDTSWQTAALWGYLPDSAIWEGKPWALITSSFVHMEILHLAFNVYWLWILGACFEETLGWMHWLLFFVGAAWVSAAMELLLGGQSGIGMSGVNYALFGFGWVARSKLSRFAEIVDNHTAQIFLLWLVACVVLTNANVMQIANWAHIFGLAFRAGIAALWVVRWRPWIPAAGLVLLLGIAFVPLAWCPLSPDWTGVQAAQAQEKEDYESAINWYKRSLALGHDPIWVWDNLSRIYGYQEKEADYAKAMHELRQIDSKAAKEVEADYGAPTSTGE